MKFRLLSVTVLLFIVFSITYSQRPGHFAGCQPEGSGRKTQRNPTGALHPRFIEWNLLKNRDRPPSVIDRSITITELLDYRNNDKFRNSQGAEITGYVAYVYNGEAEESANCARKDLRDVHIAIVCKPAYRNDKTRWMFVEVPPRFQRALGNAQSLQYLEQRWVKFRGWMFYDGQHASNARLVNPRGKALWRATPWEIHPVTDFRIVQAPAGNDLCP